MMAFYVLWLRYAIVNLVWNIVGSTGVKGKDNTDNVVNVTLRLNRILE